jgi:hypothetical protein
MIVVVDAGVCSHEQLPPRGEAVWTVTGSIETRYHLFEARGHQHRTV